MRRQPRDRGTRMNRSRASAARDTPSGPAAWRCAAHCPLVPATTCQRRHKSSRADHRCRGADKKRRSEGIPCSFVSRLTATCCVGVQKYRSHSRIAAGIFTTHEYCAADGPHLAPRPGCSGGCAARRRCRPDAIRGLRGCARSGGSSVPSWGGAGRVRCGAPCRRLGPSLQHSVVRHPRGRYSGVCTQHGAGCASPCSRAAAPPRWWSSTAPTATGAVAAPVNRMPE